MIANDAVEATFWDTNLEVQKNFLITFINTLNQMAEFILRSQITEPLKK